MAIQIGVPAEPVSFLLVTSQPQIRVTHTIGVRLARMLGVVKDKHIRRRGLGGNDTRILGHITGPVDLSFVIDLNFNLNLSRDAAKASKFALFIVIMRGIELGILIGQLH